jgi:predicted TIM-barrel fold metal-dependent hydrolase
MLIVDAQIHLWEKGTPSAHHRQEPYSAEQAIAGMDEAGVDRALIHPVLWDPDSNELAAAAVRKHPDRFAIMGWFYLDDPNGRDLVAHWKERPGMLGLRFYTNERHPQSWFTDGTLDWLWPAAERAQVPGALGRTQKAARRTELGCRPSPRPLAFAISPAIAAPNAIPVCWTVATDAAAMFSSPCFAPVMTC